MRLGKNRFQANNSGWEEDKQFLELALGLKNITARMKR